MSSRQCIDIEGLISHKNKELIAAVCDADRHTWTMAFTRQVYVGKITKIKWLRIACENNAIASLLIKRRASDDRV